MPLGPSVLTPSRLLVIGFAVAIAAGAILLALPGVVQDGFSRHSSVDAVFTATSAVCVTGLAVRDLSEYTWFGQLVVLLLIQVGGLGIVSLSKLAMLRARNVLKIGDRDLVDTAFGHVRAVTPRQILVQTVLFTGLCEALGFLALAPVFVADHGWGFGLWAALFHSVSAFCNAGFGLWSDSLASYRDHPWINGVIMSLIIAGGLGFVVVAELWTWLRQRGRHRLSLHSRTVAITTLILILGGWAAFVAIEWFNTDEGSSQGDLLPSLFLSVTARTAGFSTISMDHLSHPSLLVMIFLMMVGGSPGSTAGGIKTTTLATLFALVRARARGRPDAELLGRAIGSLSVGKALATASMMVAAILIGIVALEIAESGVLPHHAQSGRLLDHCFEVVSALGTVGLSTGITPHLGDGGKIIILCCMFAGRLGPLLIASSVVGRTRGTAYSLPREDVIIG